MLLEDALMKNDNEEFNAPGSSKIGITPEFTDFVVNLQIDNVCKILNGEVKHYICTDRTTSHKKIVIEYEHSSNLQ